MNLSLFCSKLILHKKSFLQLLALKLFESYNKFILKKTFRPEFEIIIDYYLSKEENKNLDHIIIIEFGVSYGKSLKYLEDLKIKFEKRYKVEIRLFGFDTFEGMPKTENIYDQPYDWNKGDYISDYQTVQSKVKSANLIKGDIKNTVNRELFESYNISNILIILFDLDYFSSTNNSFKIFENSFSSYMLPRVGLFFDNIHSSSEISGEYYSIQKFNDENIKNGKIISKDFYLEKFDNRFYQYLNLNHKLFSVNKKKRQIL